ncbi:hypothetical protein [Clostridium beijerinckii]|uniref:Uncharacterized protein n=1 Tax=Clostridium beijerinckii TaxID=1520 RepID=A0A0B5QH40_CLOBE|nr:hypothetical protein [Clostridium beijerinckii]AJH00246.1 hypothetical protein LF65_03691 [Clostridium beijerinckii]AQS05970.1 hypothetical protein CLBIJ_34130 [Clostridium beijerinckii]MBA2888122.1 hypothetical protein [Clostridium beijerinckii]MBA2902858.1 hypothetical protein [Clostridium beijerinckii]MBA2912684.1 hypothetical protein [Clostridium beijerinckii]
MVLIERTIYARFSRIISENELIKLYTPHDEDISIAYKYAKGLPGFNYVKMNFPIDKKQFINHLKSMSKGIKFKNRNHQIANETFH